MNVFKVGDRITNVFDHATTNLGRFPPFPFGFKVLSEVVAFPAEALNGPLEDVCRIPNGFSHSCVGASVVHRALRS
jgi:hypothetical protein